VARNRPRAAAIAADPAQLRLLLRAAAAKLDEADLVLAREAVARLTSEARLRALLDEALGKRT
jgi:hypothetical protein